MNHKNTIHVKEVDIDNALNEEQIIKLIESAFNSQVIEKGYLKRNIHTQSSSQSSIFLCAFEDNQMIACNAFIANDFLFKNKLSVCYQSCWSATHPQHQGKGAFIKIQEEAKKILKERGALLIYGLPNSVSRPIFIKKLYFSEQDSLQTIIPNIPILRNLWLKRNYTKNSYLENSLITNEKQIIELKKNLNPKIIEIKRNSSLAWGKISSRKKLGYKWKIFTLGGINIESDQDFPLLMKDIFKIKCHFVEIVSCSLNETNNRFRFWKILDENKFIFFFLNENETNFVNFNLMRGVGDTF